ncbi:MAG: aminopeptidase P family protein [Synergistetes bacterium]|nr:aminopeptidase P family protein [Synergistota bacterium]
MLKGVSSRVKRLREYVFKRGLDFALILNPLNQYYYSGFYALIYSRPIILLISPDESHLIVPALEELHSKEDAQVDHIHVYYEHPEKASEGIDPFGILKRLVSKKGWRRAGIEKDALPLYIYELLRDAGVVEFGDIGSFIAKERLIKDEEELKLIREAGKLVSVGVAESLKVIREGITEVEIDGVGGLALLKYAGDNYPGRRVELFVMSPSGRERSALPHVFSISRKLQKGDIIIHSRQVALDGYRAECERTVFLGEPTDKDKEYFKIMFEAQRAAIEAVKPGVKCKDIDKAARSVIQKAKLGEYANHRTGHGLGLSAHEAPYLRFDAEDTLEAGMVVSIEPGFYIPGVGGFRHSDTVIVTPEGYEVVTEAPSELEECIITV